SPSRVDAMDWPGIAGHLDGNGWAVLPRLLSSDECGSIAGLYGSNDIFRSHIIMGRHGFGRGEYKYFSYPLPEIISG
ncbi:prolyl 4-hydroxylase subunit alpha, partial [Acinetobacter baumannii]